MFHVVLNAGFEMTLLPSKFHRIFISYERLKSEHIISILMTYSDLDIIISKTVKLNSLHSYLGYSSRRTEIYDLKIIYRLLCARALIV